MHRITRESIDPRVLEATVRTDACGGVVTFLGVVRDNHGGRAVDGLEYEAHEEMALAEFHAIVSEVLHRWPEVRIAVTHRVGSLDVGEIAVAVCAAAPHRAEAFDACEYTIDELKKRAPIWKKERYVDGTSEWVENAC